jgi:hypothetical protein
MGIPMFGFQPGFCGPELHEWPSVPVEIDHMIFVVGRVEDVPCNCQPCVASGQTCKRSRYYLQGVFTEEVLAVEACSDASYFVGPLPINSALPHEMVEWRGLYFPFAERKDDDAASGNTSAPRRVA